jgi:hypothetical protein
LGLGGDDGEVFWLLLTPSIVLPLAIPISLFYRLYVLLKDGYNPTIQIDTFFPQSGAGYSWKGVEMVYDYVASSPIEVVVLIGWMGLVWITIGILDD